MPAGPQNTMPSSSYDFFAPLGEYGQPRPHYHMMRRLHLFLQAFGDLLAEGDPVLPLVTPSSHNDTATVRWSIRTNGTLGLLFVNNYQRETDMPAKSNVQFLLKANGSSQLGDLLVPSAAFTVPANTWFYWPFRWPVGPLTLTYATAQVS